MHGRARLEVFLGRQLRHERPLTETQVREALVAEVFDELDVGIEAEGAVLGRPDADVLGTETDKQRVRSEPEYARPGRGSSRANR